MAKRMLIDAAHPEETRVVVLNGNRLEEFDFETSTKKQIKGNIYLAKVTRVEPSLQAAFVEYGGNRHGFLAFSEIHPDYYRIPVGDRRAAEARDARARELVEDARQAAAADEIHAESAAAEDGEDHRHDAPDDGEAAYDVPEHEHEGPPEGYEPPQTEAPPAPLAAESGRDDRLYGETHGGEHHHAADELIGGPAFHAPASSDPMIVGAAHADETAERFETVGQSHSPAGEIGEAHPPHEPAGDNGTAHGEETSSLAEVIETLGGDEIEEAPRPRTRPFRHYKIQEVIKRRQIMLVQVTKEERGNKGAALTTFLSLAGRYCVLMPNTPRGGGVSRKITNALDRRRLKDLMSDLDVPDGMGVIVRTAGSERSKAEIKRDFEYLLRLWDDIRDLTLKSTAPALIYEEGNLIKRSIRDLYTRDIEEVIIDGEEGHGTAKAFMKMLMPSHTKRIKLYRDPSVALFHRFQVENQIDAIHSPIVQLRSGGYIVINPTEALVAIDVNSGRSTKERNIEETALKTNIEAAEEIARQLRLRDLAGLIVIDFIDMEEHRNQGAVERRLKDAMRHDRARIQLGRISPFGLLEMSRQRLRPSLLEASTQPCPHCNGTGHIRSTESTALHVLRAIEEEGMRRRSAEISVAVPTAVALYILNHKRDALVHAEQRYGFRVSVGSDDALVPPAFRLERLRALTPAEIAALPVPTALPVEAEEEDEETVDLEQEADGAASSEDYRRRSSEEGAPAAAEPIARALAEHQEEEAERAPGEEMHGRRRRRRRRRGRRDRDGAVPPSPALATPETEEEIDAAASAAPGESPPVASGDGELGGGRKRRRRGRRGGRRRRRGEFGDGAPGLGAEAEEDVAEAVVPIAETVEYVPPQAPNREEDRAAIEAALSAPTVPAEMGIGAEAGPVSAAAEPQPRERQPDPSPEESATRHHASTELPTHEVSGPPPNPKRGWWRRVIDR
jgi:ribonuclease E